MEEALSPETQAVVDRVQKLLAMANHKASNQAEAANAAAMAQRLLAQHNLDLATVEQQGGESGRREQQRVRGGMYAYERELWGEVAQLNFCKHWCERYRWEHRRRDGSKKEVWSFRHRVVGRVVNVRATMATADYLLGTIERLCRERLATRSGTGDESGSVNSQFFSRWAVAFREGAANEVVRRLARRRRDDELARTKESEARARTAGASTATALTIADVRQSEDDANEDFLRGEPGWSARRRAEREEYRRERELERQAEEAAATAWAAAHPEEAAAQEKKARQEEQRRWRRGGGGGRYRGPDTREQRQDSGGYAEGQKQGRRIGIDPQTAGGKSVGRIG